MNAERKAEWVAALRSGKYEQTTLALTKIAEDGTMKHCCLGVACQILGIESKVEGKCVAYAGERIVLPDVAVNELELDSYNPRIRFNDGTVTSLANLNDDGLTFPQIADLIEYFL